MLRAFLVVGLILALLSAAVFAPRLLRTEQETSAGAGPTECDVMAQTCRWSTASGTWSAQLKPVGVNEQGSEYELAVTAPVQPERFLAVLRGESMYMGEYPVPLRRQSDGSYRARFSAPVCSTGNDMRWRIDLQAGQEPLEGGEAKLVFQAREL